jgi:fatty acid desaturase
VALFITGCVCCEFGKHERIMHKQHHTFTNNIDKDPELTSYYSREQLDNPAFRNIPSSRWSYFKQFWDVRTTFKCRLFRVINSARGIAVDYSGTGWSLKEWTYSKESGILDELQYFARLQLLIWAAVFATFGQTKEGLASLFFWWIVPVIVGYPAVNYFRNLEHSDCEVSKEPNFLRNTRTCESNLLIRLLLWDTNYHAEHHCYPMVPFFNLHKVHELMKGHVLHGEIDHFTIQNWNCVKQGGWIDQQAADMAKAKSE